MSPRDGRLAPVHIVVGFTPDGVLLGHEDGASERVAEAEFPARVRQLEAEEPRWVWDDTSIRYPPLLAAGVRVARCVDLRLSHVILRNSALTSDSELAKAEPGPWDRPPRRAESPG